MLMHHADAVADRLARRGDAHRLAVDANFAGVGLVEAVEDRHQRRFAGAVFADDAMNDAALDAQIDVVVGVNRAESLIDADEFDGGRRRLLASSVTRAPKLGRDRQTYATRCSRGLARSRRRRKPSPRPGVRAEGRASRSGAPAQTGHLLSAI